MTERRRSTSRFEAIAGVVPSPLDPMPGCRFAPRCPFAWAVCLEAAPPLREIAAGHEGRVRSVVERFDKTDPMGKGDAQDGNSADFKISFLGYDRSVGHSQRQGIKG
jgi:hypothetical protein